MRLEFSDVPSEAYRQVWIMHGVMIGAVLLCLFAGLSIADADPEFEAQGGYFHFDDFAWPLRVGALLYLSPVVLLIVLFFSEHYVGVGVGLTSMVIWRPTRSHWGSVFSRASVDHPGVTGPVNWDDCGVNHKHGGGSGGC